VNLRSKKKCVQSAANMSKTGVFVCIAYVYIM